MKKFVCLFILTFFFLFFSKTSFAEPSYVLPYPPIMPGSLAYNFRIVFEKISRHWHFGDFGQFKYNLKMSDKYLVEAKTLFEYKQYLLARRALKKSDIYFANALPSLIRASKRNKDIIQKRNILKGASQKHIEVLEKIRAETPDVFVWQPEKALPTTINIGKAIFSSISLRKKIYE